MTPCIIAAVGLNPRGPASRHLPNGRLLARECTLTWARTHRVAHPKPPNRDEWPRFRSMVVRTTVFGGWGESSGKFRFTTVGCPRHRYPRVTTGPPAQKAAGVRCMDDMRCGEERRPGRPGGDLPASLRRRCPSAPRPVAGSALPERGCCRDHLRWSAIGAFSVVGLVLILIRWQPRWDWRNVSASSALAETRCSLVPRRLLMTAQPKCQVWADNCVACVPQTQQLVNIILQDHSIKIAHRCSLNNHLLVTLL